MNVYFNVTIKIVLLLIIILVYSYITCPNLHLGNSVVPFYKRTDNKFPEINEDYTHPNVSILLTSGLSNRIRTMLGFIEVCKHFNKKLIVIWVKDETCNGNYLDYFKPIDGVEFIDSLTSVNYDNIDYVGQSKTLTILDNYKIKDYKNNYYHIVPIDSLQTTIDTFVCNNNIKECVGIHVRRTDYTGNLIGKILNGANSDREFCDYIDKYSRGKGYFLATDNRDSQEYYIKKYGKRTIVYSSIKETNSLRKTSLENAIVDIYLLSYCKSIKGTYNSSFTDFARLLKKSRNYDLKA